MKVSKKITVNVISLVIFMSIFSSCGSDSVVNSIIDRKSSANEAGAISSLSVGDIIEFGSYPQNKVTDKKLISKLNNALNSDSWGSYNYYSGEDGADSVPMKNPNLMFYSDVEYDEHKYRAVIINEYRPEDTSFPPTAENTSQDENGYKLDTVYWFEFVPLRWVVLNPETGFVLTEKIIDSQPFNEYIIMHETQNEDGVWEQDYYINSKLTSAANDYSASSLRKWLNNSFYDTAFSNDDKSMITKTSDLSDESYPVREDSPQSTESNYVFLISKSDVLNSDYGFSEGEDSSDPFKKAKLTDYSKSQGASFIDDKNIGIWQLRTPLEDDTLTTQVIWNDGTVANCYANETSDGIRPALYLKTQEQGTKTTPDTSEGTATPTDTNAEENKKPASDSGAEKSVKKESSSKSEEVNKKKLKSIKIKTVPSKTTYFVGDLISVSGLSIEAKYDNGNTETINSGFSCSPKKFEKTGKQTVTVSYSGKKTSFDVNVKNPVISEIAVKTPPNKTEYIIGDSLDTSGLTLSAIYNNGSQKTISGGFNCNPTKLVSPGNREITVSYGDFTTSFYVNVREDYVNKISIITKPEKLTYYQGDTLDTSGLALTAVHLSGKKEKITAGYSCSPEKLSSAGSQTITVTYEGAKTTYSVTVKELTLSSVKIETLPTKTTYYEGDSFKKDGLTLSAIYSNGTKKTITGGFTCSPTKLNTAGKQEITVVYNEKSTSFEVTVKENTVTDISVKTSPKKTTYATGTSFDPNGLTLTATYANGKTQTVKSGFTYTPDKFDELGTQTITISYGGKKTTLKVEVQAVALVSIKVRTLPKKTSYIIGDYLDTTGLTLTAKYNNDKEKTVTEGFTCSPETLTESGSSKTVTVTYEGKTTTFKVEVKSDAVSKIRIVSKPDKLTYFVGESLNSSGLTLVATHLSGKEETVETGFTCTPKKLNNEGEQEITVTYKKQSATFYVTVLADRLESIKVKSKPKKIKYLVGEDFDPTGMTLTATYASGKTQTVSDGYDCQSYKITQIGPNTITITYQGKSTVLDVKGIAVKEIKSVSGLKPTYYVGDTIDISNISVSVKYTDNTTATIRSGISVSPQYVAYEGQNEIEVSVDGVSKTVYVTGVDPNSSEE